MQKRDESVSENPQFIESIAKIADHLASVAPRKKVTHHDYLRARQKRNKLTRQVYMSGVKIREKQLSEEEIRLLNQIKPGNYNGGRWNVIAREAAGLEGGAIDIFVRNKTREDQMQLSIDAPSLSVLLKKMLAEQAAKETPVRRRPVPFAETADSE